MAVVLSQTVLPSPEAEVNAALGDSGLTTRTARFDDNLLRFFRNGEFSTPLYASVSENPWQTPVRMDIKRRELAGFAGRMNDTLAAGGAWVGWGTRRTLVGNPIAAEEASARKAVSFAAVWGELRKRKVVTGAMPKLTRVPKAVEQAAALILATVIRTKDLRSAAIQDLGDPATAYGILAKGMDENSPANVAATLNLYRRFHTHEMAAASHDLLLAVQSAAPIIASVPPTERYGVRLKTAWGQIVLTGGTATMHPDDPTLLVIDTGGNDTYVNTPSTHSHQNWCSLVLDAAGDDKYVSASALLTTPVAQFSGRKSATRPGPAGAIMGCAAIYDLAGNDLYRSHAPGLGSGQFGVGSLYDGQGTDAYDAYANSQGFGLFGAGILEDNGGSSDTYEGFSQVQGVGLTQGFGCLIDRGGNERYTANDERIDFPSPQSDKHNVSMSQGAGNGRRADYLEGNSLAGGVGVLYDRAGDDQYRCGVFGQGVGYWMGVGALWDGAGTDRYYGQWYVQGASAHFAVGYLEDEGGNDDYQSPMNMAQGAGHDFSVGILVDRSGDDKYAAPNLSLGAGNANGIGWFAELSGDDEYVTTGITLGKGAEAPKDSLRTRGLSLGVFMDLEGRDSYPIGTPWAKESTKTTNWTTRLPDPAESQLGVFWDR
jgi:hypothetical protein